MPRAAASRVRASRRRISASEGRISGGGVSRPSPVGLDLFPGRRGWRRGTAAVGGAGPAHCLAVDRRGRQQRVRGRVLDPTLGGAALFPLGRTGRGRYHRGSSGAAGDLGGPVAERGVQCVSIQRAQHAAEGPLAGHQEPAS
jgi:hypothetical protein